MTSWRDKTPESVREDLDALAERLELMPLVRCASRSTAPPLSASRRVSFAEQPRCVLGLTIVAALAVDGLTSLGVAFSLPWSSDYTVF